MDVICAGDPRGTTAAARALARERFRVGVTTVLPDDQFGRALKAKLERLGVDTAGVALQADRPLIATSFDETQEGELPWTSRTDHSPQIEIPARWTASVLLLSGASPFVARSAAFCKAARAARRSGASVVFDLDVRWRLWRGRDPRTLQMLLREVDVVCGSAQDLFGLNLDAVTLMKWLRRGALFATADSAAAICAELARVQNLGSSDVWKRALDRGYVAG